MRKKRKHRSRLSVVTICLLLLFSCSSGPSAESEIAEIDFHFTEEVFEDNKLVNNSIVEIKSYYLRYNPKHKGLIYVTLTNDSTYKAPGLDASQINSLLNLLNTKGLKFDKVREEFILERRNYE